MTPRDAESIPPNEESDGTAFDYPVALPPSAPPALDVERLLTVLRARKPHTFTTSLTMYGDEVAAEYARLQEPER